MKQFTRWAIALSLLLALAPGAYALPGADVVFVVDESGSMSGEHSWLGNMVTQLNTALSDAGVTDNQYALVGFGAYPEVAGHSHTVGTGLWGTASELATATAGLEITGGLEDGWQAIDFALNNYTFRAGAATNFILITDEDRDNASYYADTTNISYSSVLSGLAQQGALLNAVLNAYYADDASTRALGIDSEGTAFIADGLGSFTEGTGGTTTYAYGTTKADYVDLALGSGGAAWDLNLLRAGGLTATSFTEAFIDIKVQEIEEQIENVVPEPGTFVLFGLGLTGLGYVARKRRLQA